MIAILSSMQQLEPNGRENPFFRSTSTPRFQVGTALLLTLIWTAVYFLFQDPLTQLQNVPILTPTSSWYTVGTTQFFHADPTHLMANIVLLLGLLWLIPNHGSIYHTMKMWCAGGLVGTVGSFYLEPAVLLGASGGLTAMFGFGLFLFAKSTNADRSWTQTLPLGVIVVVCLPGDVYAHLGGFLYGFLIHRLTFIGSRLHSLIATSVVLCWAAFLLRL